MESFTYTIKDPAGIHARPAGLLVKKAREFQSAVTLEVKGQKADAKGILGVMSLGAAQGDTLTVSVDGSDAAEAATQIRSFIQEHL